MEVKEGVEITFIRELANGMILQSFLEYCDGGVEIATSKVKRLASTANLSIMFSLLNTISVLGLSLSLN
jgi:hypothetical protein